METDKLRSEFEEWAIEKHDLLLHLKTRKGLAIGYLSAHTQIAWEAWQEATRRTWEAKADVAMNWREEQKDGTWRVE